MRSQCLLMLWVLSSLLGVSACKARDGSSLNESVGEYADHEGYEGVGLSVVEERGRRIWYEATGDNGRFHTYIVSQKVGVPEDWYKVLGSHERDRRWPLWGIIPDPDCKPGNAASYGYDICKGDAGEDGLLAYVGKEGWKDPGCYISGSYVEEDCALGLGTSTGGLGFRKFPNPRFDKDSWPGWNDYVQSDGSVEPPFLIGTACGSCHISYDPNNPPKNPNKPKWANIKGLVGNQYQHDSEIIASGASPHSLEWQAATNSRPGTVDTSAHPNDMISNPNTMNAIINVDRRPPGFPQAFKGEAFRSFDKTIINEETGSRETHRVLNILKGGEDDVGGAGTILRVYVNEGLCAEPCWMNNLVDMRSIEGRGSRQTPFSSVQCRRDCPSYRALEKHYESVLSFFVSKAGRPTDLKDAMFPDTPKEERYTKLVAKLGEGKVKRGRKVFAKNCATCHSSQKPPEGQQAEDFFEDLVREADETGVDPFLKEENGVRLDWLGNEEREPVTKIGTNRCRALHSNHMAGAIWDVYSSETYKNSPAPAGVPELKGHVGGGRGYYRNPSLLSMWAQAPFLHNNAIGPEYCSDLHPRSPCIERDAVKLKDGSTAMAVSVEGRLQIFDDSMDQLLNPDKRGRKITRTDADIVVPLGPQAGSNVASWNGLPILPHLGLLLKLWGMGDLADQLSNAKLIIPKGTPVSLLGSLDYRRLVKGLMADLAAMPANERPRKLVETLNSIFQDPNKLADILKAGPRNGDPTKYNGYANCTDVIEDKGHEFGANLDDDDKDALTAFMKTL